MIAIKEKSNAVLNNVGMVLIPAGVFSMGSLSGSSVEKPVHEVYLDDFYIDAAPVTNAEFAKFVEATNYQTTAETLEQTGEQKTWKDFAFAGRENHPVVLVSWEDAAAYAKWAGKRLPTEAEWEKAARGGLKRMSFPWGDTSPNEKHTNWNQVLQDLAATPPTTAIKSFSPNDYGVYEMTGNVWEWCADWYADNYYSISPADNPQGPEQGIYKVRRGASWNVREDFRLRCANRGAMSPEKVWTNLGFRCAI